MRHFSGLTPPGPIFHQPKGLNTKVIIAEMYKPSGLFPIATSPEVPSGEVWLVQGGQVVGRIVNVDER